MAELRFQAFVRDVHDVSFTKGAPEGDVTTERAIVELELAAGEGMASPGGSLSLTVDGLEGVSVGDCLIFTAEVIPPA